MAVGLSRLDLNGAGKIYGGTGVPWRCVPLKCCDVANGAWPGSDNTVAQPNHLKCGLFN